ncbi:MAG: porin family protein [Muribaculaceae bacterium]|nr:porin family protein [Muribaculaceae bacterium]MBR1725206.1 porin family protein [Muribaculaceae bacterium]
MKRIFAMLCGAAMALCASAQAYQGQISAGVNLLYGSYTESFGFGARFQYVPYDQLRGVVEFDYFTGHKGKNLCDININAEYMIPIKTDAFYIYPLVGFNYSMSSHRADDGGKVESNHVGLNLGAGLEYEINDHFAATMEYRHTIIRKIDQGVFALGACYKF